MRTSISSALRFMCLFATLWSILLSQNLARADGDWYQHYDKAESAIAREQWSEALRELNAALEQRQQSGARVRTYGMRFVSYFPFLRLGIAYFHLDQLDAASQALDTELSQGEVSQSESDLALLQSYRKKIESQRELHSKQREARVVSIVASSLAAASELQQQGKLEDALTALGRALAVAPNDASALAAREQLRAALADQVRHSDAAQRAAALLREGKAQLAARNYSQAAASFQALLDLDPDLSEGRTLLAQAQHQLRGETDRASASASAGTARSTQARLDSVRKHFSAGAYSWALSELQLVLALEPQNAAAIQLQAQILRAQRDSDRLAHRDGSIGESLREAEQMLAEGRPEEAQRAANRVLILDPANADALSAVTRAYAQLSALLLTTDSASPTIVLSLADGAQAIHTTRNADIVITGSVYDNSPVELTITAAGAPVGEVTVSRRQLQGLWVSEFSWRHAVEPGLFECEVSAVDPAGNRASLPYATEYVVPLIRTRWFQILLLAMMGALVAIYLMVRVRRRRRIRRDRFNPYVAGAPILEQQRFFGRQQLLEYVLRRISNNSIMLYGERRIGKTSFQHQLKRYLSTHDDPHHQFFPVYVDLQGTPQELFFATLAAEIFQELAPKLGGLQPAAALDKTPYDYREFVVDLHRVLDVLKKQTAKKVKIALLIDEVDELNDYDPRVNQRLRSLFMRAFAEHLVAVVSGVAIKKQWEREGSPWYNFFQEVEVKPLDAAEARSLIEAPVRGVFSFETGVADEIIRRTTSRPYLIQKVCSSLVDRMHEERRYTITVADVEAGCALQGVGAETE